MVKKFTLFLVFILLSGSLWAQGDAGAVFLLIAPGARAEAMGEAQVANTKDAYSSYWNPAGLAFMDINEVGLMYVKWLPNLVDDMYYNFLTTGYRIPGFGTVGGHVIYLNLGEQERRDESGNDLGTFVSYLTAVTVSYGTKISQNQAFGVNAKIVYQMLSPFGTIQEKGKGSSTSFAFDFGYLYQGLLWNKMDFGINLSNVGPKVAFIDVAQADPMPTNMKLGVNLKFLDKEHNKFSVVFDANKLLVASYPAMDRNGNLVIDKDTKEEPYADPWYKALITSWYNDWKYKGDIDYSGDGFIGGYDAEGNRQGGYNEYGEPVVGGDYDENGNLAVSYHPETGEELVGWGIYGGSPNKVMVKKEIGSKNDGSFKNEIEKIIFNIGAEYAYNNMIFLRAGYIYDQAGKIFNPTAGFGLMYHNIGFDFGYTGGEKNHPLTNTMRISLRYCFGKN
ncbi:MAG: PorV/PorQ family protein [Candidatus Marinimicrobia bacterium]|nr:PorV/PorQ family protein [Candidatus Neomarinimicrobiota bacterium]MDD5582390.1 PorV/PorQ family protein [Candidatus Neomarinimicrobiota bacterium]